MQLPRLLDAGTPVHLRVAGLTIQVSHSAPDLNVAPGTAWSRFVVEAAPPDVAIEVSAHTLGEDGAGACLFDSGGPWRLYRHGDGFLFRFHSATLESSPYKTALFNHDFSRGHVWLHRPFFAGAPLVDPLEYPLDELLVISLLGQGRGVEIHGCGVVDGSRGYLFVGQSGAGKTTMARLWQAVPGAVILSDDRVVLRSDADGHWMYGTPWHGEEPLASPGRVRLAGVFFLKHHDRQEIATVTRIDGVTRLFASSFLPFHDANALDFTLAFIDSLVGRVPCFELWFTPDAAALELVRRTCEAPDLERLSPATADNSRGASRHPPRQ